MYYRRKILLSLLEIFGGELEDIRLQKLLMLLSKLQEKPSFDFVPCSYGCFSFQAKADLKTLSKYKQVLEHGKIWKKIGEKSYIAELKQRDKQALIDVKDEYQCIFSEQLTDITNEMYPFYALNVKASNADNLNQIRGGQTQLNGSKLFTIGYEGIFLETYLNKLIRNGVRYLLDVRRNSFSMKYGFSKSQLREACHEINIEYYHLPELGIESDKRKELKTQSDYDSLFEEYKEENLPNTVEVQRQVLGLIKQYQRVALTCFEADICQCHRKPLAESISKLSGSLYEVEHI